LYATVPHVTALSVVLCSVKTAQAGPIQLALDQSATSEDILLSVLQAAHLRKMRMERPSDGNSQLLVRESLVAAKRDFRLFYKVCAFVYRFIRRTLKSTAELS
jgi:hypothetical protein